jgi:PAS domain S-box-containing protein
MADDAKRAGSLSESGYRAVFMAAPDGMILVDGNGQIRDLNPAAELLFGYSREEMKGKRVELLVPHASRSAHVEHRDRYMEDPRPRPMGIGMELSGMRKDGVSFPVEIGLSPFETQGETLVIAAVRDLSQHHRLRRFSVETMRAAEEERRKLARELHDDTAQQLAATLLRIRMAQRTTDAEARSAILDDVRSDIVAATDGIRRIARGLRPPALADVGMIAALRAHIRTLTEASGRPIALRCDVPGKVLDSRLDDDARLVLYRVIQESLSNAVRHAGAGHIEVRLHLSREAGERLVAEIEDDGTGFALPGVELGDGRGLGLMGMQERAAIASGSLSVDSAPGKGTTIRLEIPLTGGQDER